MTSTAGAAGTFTDDDGSVHETDIEWIAAAGITRGCNPPANTLYCPNDAVTRGQMAAFLTRALDLAPDDNDQFADDDASIFENDIQALAAAGITRGCNPSANTLYCPNDAVTRGQMAAFLTRALDLPASPTDTFQDDDSSIFEAEIQALSASGITRGCNPPTNDLYCPDDPVTRAQMASFLRRALDDDGTPTTDNPPTTDTTTATTFPPTTTTTSIPPPDADDAVWREVPENGTSPADRHENGFIKVGDDFYLIGGRGLRPVQRYDVSAGRWVNTGVTTTDLHHFQPVVWGDKVYIVGALTDTFQNGEPPATNIWIFDPSVPSLTEGPVIPADVRRGAGGTVVHAGWIYLVSGNDGGHGTPETDNIDRFDRWNPVTNAWETLPRVPHPRDHFHAVVDGDRLYVVGGRTSEVPFGMDMFEAVVEEVDVFDFSQGAWLDASDAPPDLPDARAASMTAGISGLIYVIGGEGGSMSEMNPPSPAWSRVDRLDTSDFSWEQVPAPIDPPRHGTGGVVCADDIYVAAGATTRGGTSETDDFQALDTQGDGLDCLP